MKLDSNILQYVLKIFKKLGFKLSKKSGNGDFLYWWM
jgi:hypothetical protein